MSLHAFPIEVAAQKPFKHCNSTCIYHLIWQLVPDHHHPLCGITVNLLTLTLYHHMYRGYLGRVRSFVVHAAQAVHKYHHVLAPTKLLKYRTVLSAACCLQPHMAVDRTFRYFSNVVSANT